MPEALGSKLMNRHMVALVCCGSDNFFGPPQPALRAVYQDAGYVETRPTGFDSAAPLCGETIGRKAGPGEFPALDGDKTGCYSDVQGPARSSRREPGSPGDQLKTLSQMALQQAYRNIVIVAPAAAALAESPAGLPSRFHHGDELAGDAP